MSTELTPQAFARKAMQARVRTEASIVRLSILNKVLPVMEKEFDRRLSSGEALELTVPSADALAEEYLTKFFSANGRELEAGDE